MPAPRHVSFPGPVCTPRASLDAVQQSGVDRVLKDLKSCTRKLQAAFASHQVELQILERLYYKGNNQHRHALFWRRVCDVRRFGRRLESVQIYELLETLRLAFWGDASQHNAKSLKAAWTHTPDAKYTRSVLDRLRESLVLVDSMEQHLAKAFSHLNLELQTGAFLQLILTLTAITSRMAHLLTEMGPTIAQAWSACYRLLEILTPGPMDPPPKSLSGQYKILVPGHIDSSRVRSRSASRPTHDIQEDVGDVVVTRREVVQTVTRSVTTATLIDAPDATTQDAADDETVTVTEDLSVVFTQPQELPPPGTVVRETVKRTTVKTKEFSEGPARKRSATSTEVHEVKTKKKRKKKDEIDDIFGF